MRITASDGYYCEGECVLGDTCERHYCAEDRLLYRDCDTAEQGTEGDRDVIGGTRTLWYSEGECPECLRRERTKARRRELERWFAEAEAKHPGLTLCPDCWDDFMRADPADVAIHLIDRHGWETDAAQAWLRDKVEAAAFHAAP